MTRVELLAKLRELAAEHDTESAHAEADDLIVDFLGDQEITEAYDAIGKWYA